MRSPVHPHGCGEYAYCHAHGACSPVHPHGCGEYMRIQACRMVTPVHPHGCGEDHDQVALNCGRVRLQVHPHGCGENVARRHAPYADGSSPRVWGTRSNGTGTCTWSRFIPTGVGNDSWISTSLSRLHRFIPTGVGTPPVPPGDLTSGSSPRVWGRPSERPDLGESVQPTGVGNTKT